MKKIILIMLLVVAIVAWSGHNFWEKHKEAVDASYLRGLKDGAEGIKIAYNSVWAILWAKYTPKYPSIHDTPWEEFELREKMFLCAYGSPGNKMSIEDFRGMAREFGSEELRISKEGKQ